MQGTEQNAGRSTRFKPGQSGNPKGRPKGVLYPSEELRRQLRQPYPKDEEGRSYLQRLIAALLERAIGGDVGAIREVFDRLEGKPAQSVALDVGVTDVGALIREYGIEEQELVNECLRLIAAASEPSGE